jgi:hypothetical protein
MGKTFTEKLGSAAMKRMMVAYDDDVMSTRGKSKPCFSSLVSNTINDLRKKVSRYGQRGEYGIVLNRKGPRKLSPEEH